MSQTTSKTRNVTSGKTVNKKSKTGRKNTRSPSSTSSVVARKKGMFSKELRTMMYGFGDKEEPLEESVDLLEEMVVDYIIEMTEKAAQVGAERGKLLTEDFLFLIRKDSKKYARVMELLQMNEELKRVRKAYDFEKAT